MLKGVPLKKYYSMFLLIALCVMVMSLSGCALLQIPAQLIDGTFSLLGKILNIANKLPKPPPGVFF
jgi:predicted aminopeptidase